MIDERINNSLRELERELSNIESARREVEKTVSSYDELKNVTASYVVNLNAITKGLDEVIKLIGEDYKRKSSDFEKDRDRIIESCNNAMRGLNDASREIENKVSSNIRIVKKTLFIILGVNMLTLIAVFALHWLK